MGLFSKKISEVDIQKKISEIGIYGRLDPKLQSHINGLLKDLDSLDMEKKVAYRDKIKETLESAGHKPEIYLKD